MKPTLLTTLIITALSASFNMSSTMAETLQQDNKVKPSTTLKNQSSGINPSPTTASQNKIISPKLDTIKTVPAKMNTPQIIKPSQMTTPVKTPTLSNTQRPTANMPSSSQNRPQAGFIRKTEPNATAVPSFVPNTTTPTGPKINSVGGPRTQDSTVFIHPSKEGSPPSPTINSVGGPRTQDSTVFIHPSKEGTTSGNIPAGNVGQVPAATQGQNIKPQESVASDGTDTFTLSNGDQTPRTDRSGNPASIDSQGRVAYPDGTTVGVDSGGNTVRTSPDGSSTTYLDRGTAGTPSQTGPSQTGTTTYGSNIKPQESVASDGTETFTLENGDQTPRTDRIGESGTIDELGRIVYPDGTTVGVDSNGNTYRTSPDGTTTTYVGRGGSDSSSSQNGNSSGDDSNDDSGNESDNDSDDSSDSDSDDDSGSDDSDSDDSSEDESSDTGESDSGGAEEDTDDSSAEGQTGHEMGTDPTRQYRSAGKDYIDSKTQPGSRETEETKPPECGDGTGGQVMEPQPGQQGCGPAISTGGDDDDTETTDPLWRAPTGNVGQDAVVQPGIGDENLPDRGLAPLERLQNDLDSITNPGRP